MSARAAWRLETLGFTQVYRYTAGKMDWFANALPIEGKKKDAPRHPIVPAMEHSVL